GDAVDVGQETLSPLDKPAGRLRDIVTAAAGLLDRNAELIQACRPRTRFNRCGYHVQDVFGEGRLDLARLLVGSEGTLAGVTGATLRTIPLPAGRSVVVLSFASLDAALRAAQLALPSGPSACELFDHRLLKLARE